jgi:hypothetical protein
MLNSEIHVIQWNIFQRIMNLTSTYIQIWMSCSKLTTIIIILIATKNYPFWRVQQFQWLRTGIVR